MSRSFPSAQLDTRYPRLEDDPWVITYTADDSAGNRATAFRRVLVVCEAAERVCYGNETADGLLGCSTGGICGVALTQSTGSGPSSGPSSSGGSSGGSSSSGTGTNTPPAITLQGDSLVAMLAGSGPYAKCSASAGALDTRCDPGATATDAEDGPLTRQVRACGTSGGGSPSLFDSVGLAACGIDTTMAGEYNVNFTVADSRGALAWASRTVRVCSSDEVVCDDLSCSNGE